MGRHGALSRIARQVLRGAAAALPTSLLALSACAPSAVKAPPPPADVSDCHACHAGRSDYPGAVDVYKFWETSGHGRFLLRQQNRPTCVACHDLKGPAAAGHLDGKKNAPGPNTYHLVEGFVAQAPKNRWEFQVQFDDYCWKTCHRPTGLPDMRHEHDGDPAKNAVQMGQHASYERPIGAGDYFMDNDVAVFPGSATGPSFVLCIACHDPHGTGATSLTGNTNRMARENFKDPPQMCSRCHI